MNLRCLLPLACAAALLLLAGCEVDFPLTARPTRPVESRLTGDWVSADRTTRLLIRPWDATTYVAVIDDDIYRAFHTDHAGLPLIAAQEFDPAAGQFVHLVWKLSDDGERLTLRVLRDEVLRDSSANRAALQRAIEQNRDHPDALLLESLEFQRRKKD